MKIKRVRSNGATEATKPQAKSTPKPRIEHNSKGFVPIFLLKPGESREMLGALQKIALNFRERQLQSIDNATTLVLTTALMHWDKLEPFIFADAAYMKAEGFESGEYFQTKTIAKKFNLKG